MTTTPLTATTQPEPTARRFAVRRYVGDTLIDQIAIVWARGPHHAARKHVTATRASDLVMSDRRDDDVTPGATRWTLTERASDLPAGSVTVVEVEEPVSQLETAQAGSATGTASQWQSALANLRDALQDAGVPPETTDNLVIRHDPEDSWLTDIETGKHLMRVESPSILEDALYGLAWAYGLGRPTPIRPYPIPRAERASQRATAAV